MTVYIKFGILMDKFEVQLTDEVVDFIESLPVKMQAKIQRTILLLEEFGFFLSEPHTKKIKNTDNLYELRVQQGNNICRLFYFHWKGSIYIILSGYMKKTDKVKPGEITRALDLMKLFIKEKS